MSKILLALVLAVVAACAVVALAQAAQVANVNPCSTYANGNTYCV